MSHLVRMLALDGLEAVEAIVEDKHLTDLDVLRELVLNTMNVVRGIGDPDALFNDALATHERGLISAASFRTIQRVVQGARRFTRA